MILINGGSSMANLSESLDQHWTQDITVPSNALCLQFSYFKEWMYYLPVHENNFFIHIMYNKLPVFDSSNFGG